MRGACSCTTGAHVINGVSEAYNCSSQQVQRGACTLRGAESGEDIHGLLQSMPTPTLTEITLNWCGEVPVHALLVLMSCVSEELFIGSCTLRGAESGEDIHGLLQSMPTPTLTKITLCSCQRAKRVRRGACSCTTGAHVTRQFIGGVQL